MNRVLLIRKGAVAPLFACLLPVLFLLSGFAINVAYMQLRSTELKVATDAAAHAGGRAMSIHQTTDAGYLHAQRIAALNQVGGQPLDVPMNEDHMKFGISIRGENGMGKYEFTQVSKEAVDNGSEIATSLAVIGVVEMPLAFQSIPGVRDFVVSRRSIATQLDRDIALVLDRSGSMQWYKDTDALYQAIYDLYFQGRISYWEMRDVFNYNAFSYNTVYQLSGDMHEYAYDRRYHSSSAARHSRWAYLELGVDAFLNVLDDTDQEEHVSLTTFATAASLRTDLDSDYDPVREIVADEYPSGWTAIGLGMETGLPAIIDGLGARPFAAKTIVILTDGENNQNPNPASVAAQIIAENNVTIHTVTFTAGADQAAMAEVAAIGGGTHYHADEGEELVAIFEEIANNLPTILTE
ncbi:MAG: VWA domain-containing protein [Mariniblastus sp.]|nr:VWA domain-containing protein [Mariniblastus sp.]